MKKFLSVFLLLMLLLAVNGCAEQKTTNEDNGTEQNQSENESQNQGQPVVNAATSLQEAIAAATGEEQYFSIEADIDLTASTNFTGKKITLDGGEERASVRVSSGAGFCFEDCTYPDTLDTAASITFKNIDFKNTNSSGADRFSNYIYSYAENVVYENCTFDGGISVFGNAEFTNCTFTEMTSSRYCIFVDNELGWRGSMVVKLDTCTFDGNNSAYGLVKVADDSEVGATLSVKDCQFSNISNKAAVYVNGTTNVYTGGTNTYTNCPTGAILAKGDNCKINYNTMTAGVSYEE